MLPDSPHGDGALREQYNAILRSHFEYVRLWSLCPQAYLDEAEHYRRRLRVERVEARPADTSVGSSILDMASHPQQQTLRADIWSSFVQWRRNWRRVYDRENDRAVMFPIEPSPWDTPEQARVRSAVSADPGAFVEIEPLSWARRLDAMRNFVESLDDESSRSALEKSFRDERPITEFIKTISLLGLGVAWRDFWVNDVVATVNAWADKNHLNISRIMQQSLSRPLELNRLEANAVPMVDQPGTRGEAHLPATG
jgi:hypothetical protein